jgi:hypothetical protein
MTSSEIISINSTVPVGKGKEIENEYVTPKTLSNAIIYAARLKEITMSREASETVASEVVAFFGFYYECIDNYLENEDRQNMYLLEDLDLIRLRSEEVYLPDGQSWRITKFILNKNKVLEYSRKFHDSARDPKNVYASLGNDEWKRI